MNENKLKPCPFCGHDAIIICNKYHRNEDYTYTVRCGNMRKEGLDICLVSPSTYEHVDMVDAINAWNGRVDDEHKS